MHLIQCAVALKRTYRVDEEHHSPSRRAEEMIIKPAKDVYDVILPIFYISKLFGLAPFMYKNDAKGKRYVAHFGIFTVLRFVAVIGLMGWASNVIDRVANFSDNIGGTALRVELYFGTVMTAAVLLLAVTNQKMVIKAVKNITDIDKALTDLGVQVTYKNVQIFAFVQMLFISCNCLSKLIIQPFSKSNALFVVYSVFNIVDCINTLMLFQYVDILLLIRQRFIWLNRKIKDIGLDDDENNDNKYQNNGLLVSTLHTQEIFPKYVKVKSMYEKKDDMKQLIKVLGIAQNKLFDVCRLVNLSYGIQLLVTIASRFTMITTQLINTYKMVQNPTFGDPVSYLLITLYLLLHSTKIFMVASLSDNTAAKGRDTGIYLHRLWQKRKDLQDEIQFFSLQILHQNLHFSACGFFKLDYTLIYAIVGALTTYLVIIIQFDLSKIDKINCHIALNDTVLI